MPKQSVIFKYKIPTVNRPTKIAMPIGAKILRFAKQIDELYIWALHEYISMPPQASVAELESKRQIREFVVRGTGEPFTLGERDVYIGTVQLDGAVLHLFEIDAPATTVQL